MKNFGRQLLIMSSVYCNKELSNNEIEALEQASILLVPRELGGKITEILKALRGTSNNITEK